MADAVSLSLDQIIKQKKIKPFQKQKAGAKKNVGNKKFGNKTQVKRLGKNRPLKTGTTKKVISDARNKIIQKKKANIGDARDRLGQLARQGDARDRLNKIQTVNTGIKATRIGPQGVASRLGAAGAQKKAALLKKQAVQNQTGKKFVKRQNVSGQGKNLTRTVAGVAGRAKNVGATGLKTAKNFKTAGNRPNQRFNKRNEQVVVVQRNQQRMRPMKQQQQQVVVRQAPYQPQYQQVVTPDMVWEPRYPQEIYQEPVYQQPRPVVYEQVRPAYREPVYIDEYDAPIRQRPMYVQQAPRRQAPMQQRMQQRVAPMQQRVQQRAPMQQRVKKQQPMSANMAARLDKKQQPQQQRGHKVLVTNLHPCVSGEDMEELFSTIGTILTSRMIREGVAEAVFAKETDALRSVEVFHNRQLDGLPMNVSIVGKKQNQKGPQPKSVLKAARGRTGAAY